MTDKPIPSHSSSGERAAFKISGGIKHFFDAFLRLLTETDTTLTEFVSSTTLLLIGAILALPQESMTTAPLLVLMARIAPEGIWAALFLSIGTFQSYANLTRHVRLRRIASFLSMVFFGFIGMLGANVTPISLFGAMCKVHALVQGLVYLRLGVQGE